MNPDVLAFAQVMAVVVATATAVAVVALGVTVAFRLTRRIRSETPAPLVDEARFARLEQAVDAIAVEVERISESQRYMARLQGELNQESSRLPSSQTGS